MATKTFRVVRAGQTTDGREVTREQITEMASSYDPKVYGARVNLEHLRGLFPGSAFGSYGDVVSVSTEEDGEHLYLLAEVDPTPDMIAMAKARQKVYFSIEMDPKFADTDQAYLVGLACTDSPASLGTSYMQFCQKSSDENPFNARKQKPENLFSSAELAWEYKETPKSIFDTVKEKLSAAVPDKTDEDRKAETAAQALAHLPTDIRDIKQGLLTIATCIDTTNTTLGNVSQTMSSFAEQQNKIKSDLSSVQDNLDTTPDDNYTARPPATGTSDYIKSDC